MLTFEEEPGLATRKIDRGVFSSETTCRSGVFLSISFVGRSGLSSSLKRSKKPSSNISVCLGLTCSASKAGLAGCEVGPDRLWAAVKANVRSPMLIIAPIVAIRSGESSSD
jgi:hypothetical protein